MDTTEINLRTIRDTTVIAPAGCGKTQLIVQTLARHQESKPILVLTHTNAGVAALQDRLDSTKVGNAYYRLSTIDGWAMRLISTFPKRSGHAPKILDLTASANDYPAIRDAAWKLLQAGHVNDVLKASYAHLIVDEYQDCLVSQHNIVRSLSLILPTCVLGDPMQAIFGFKGDKLADWNNDVCASFPHVKKLTTPWRWCNAGAEPLGKWLLSVRQSLEAGQPVDLSKGPPEHVKWIKVSPPDSRAHLKEVTKELYNTDERVFIIADSRNIHAQKEFARQTPGVSTIEAVDLKDLIGFCSSFEIHSPDALRKQLLEFASSVMTNVGNVKKWTQRLNSLQRGSARKPQDKAESLAIEFEQSPSLAGAASFLWELRDRLKVRVYRPTIFNGALKALRRASAMNIPLAEAGKQVREENRLRCFLPKRAVGSTLLLKGLEADVAILLNAESMSAQHLYVAMTRGSRKLVVCSKNPLLCL